MGELEKSGPFGTTAAVAQNSLTAVTGICGRIVPEHAELQPTSFEYLLRDPNRLTNLPNSIEDLSRHAEPWSAIE
jgi:hypothetical protein